MTPDHDPPDGAGPDCADADCTDAAAFRQYDVPAGSWRPVCARHARETHPSLELKAWLESGYMRPVAVGRPAGPPDDPATGRAEAFRELVDGAMGWAGGE